MRESTTRTSSGKEKDSTQRGKFATSFLIGMRIETGTFIDFLQAFDFARFDGLARISRADHPRRHVFNDDRASANDRAITNRDTGADECTSGDPAFAANDDRRKFQWKMW